MYVDRLFVGFWVVRKSVMKRVLVVKGCYYRGFFLLYRVIVFFEEFFRWVLVGGFFIWFKVVMVFIISIYRELVMVLRVLRCFYLFLLVDFGL